MFTRRRFLGTAAAGATVLAAPAIVRRAYAAPEYTLKLHHLLGPTSPSQVTMLQPFADRILKDTDGRVQIDIYPAMSLGGAPPQLFRQAVDGVVDIIWTLPSYTANLFPRTEAFELPNVFTGDITASNLAMREVFDKHLAEEFKDVHVLWLHVHAGQAIQMAEKLVRKPDDFNGLKIRVPGPSGTLVLEQLGATPLSMPVPDVPQALATNVVDGALIPWEVAPGLKLQDVTKYDIEGENNWRLGTSTFMVAMNNGTWDRLPDDLKTVFNDDTNTEWIKDVGRIWRQNEDDAIKVLTDAGNEHVTLTHDETVAFQQALAPVVDRWIKEHPEFDAQGLVDDVTAAIAKNSA